MAKRTARHSARFEQRRAQRETDEQLRHIRDLVRLRAILEQHGASEAELRQYDAEIARHRRRLAEVAQQVAVRHEAAAGLSGV